MEQKEFLKTIQAYRRRLNLAAFIKYSVFALSVAVAAGILIQAAALLIPLYYVNFYTLFTLLSGEFAAITVWILRRISLKQAALTMDSFGFAERIVTAYENLPQKGILVEMQRKDAMRQLRAHKDKIRIALLPSWKKLVLLLGLSAALTGLGLTPSAQKENAKEQHQLKAEAKEKVQEITEAVDSLVELGKKAEEITPEQQAALQQMIESLQSSLAEYQQAQSTEMMKAAESKLNYKYENISSDLYNMAQNLPSNASQMLTEEALQYMESMQQAAQQMQELNGSELAQGIPFSNGFNGKINQGDTAQGNNSGQNSGNDAAGSGASSSGGKIVVMVKAKMEERVKVIAQVKAEKRTKAMEQAKVMERAKTEEQVKAATQATMDTTVRGRIMERALAAAEEQGALMRNMIMLVFPIESQRAAILLETP